MSVEKLNVENAPTETSMTNLELDKKGMTEVGEELKAEGVKIDGNNVMAGEIKVGEAVVHDGRDGDPELVNFLMDDKDKYIKVEIKADVVDGKPVIKEDGKYLIWAKFLRPGWSLLNRIRGNVSVSPLTGILTGDDVNYNENIVKYLLKEWNLPLQLIFGLDLNNNEIVSNVETIIGPTGVHSVIMNELLNRLKILMV